MIRRTITLVSTGFIAAGLLWAAAPARASLIAIQNASFENGTGGWGEAVAPSDWASYDGLGQSASGLSGLASTLQTTDSTGSSYAAITAADGANVLAIQSDTGSGGPPSTDTVTVWLPSKSLGNYQANTIYTLTVALGTDPASAGQPRDSVIALSNALTTNHYADYAGIVASSAVPQSALSTSTMADYSITLDTSADPSLVGEPIGIILAQVVNPGSQYFRAVYFDNVRLDATLIPEPASLGLLGLGALALLRRRH